MTAVAEPPTAASLAAAIAGGRLSASQPSDGRLLSSSMADLGEISLLRGDDCLLRQTFLDILRHHSPKVCAKLDTIYALSDAWCSGAKGGGTGGGDGSNGGGSDEDFAALEKVVGELNPDEMIL